MRLIVPAETPQQLNQRPLNLYELVDESDAFWSERCLAILARLDILGAKRSTKRDRLRPSDQASRDINVLMDKLTVWGTFMQDQTRAFSIVVVVALENPAYP
jgi:hypothetical protein